ncbi:hypothetical protein KTO58_27090 [Chitinophaga pendula]|uniref:hypothetical protein n=1 Tax=Chitinophaga TaxID=79328 RepID=UPI000BB06970|nr:MULTISPECIES: hypothetical protein [Chitinophaga]ASZ09777.1 hypothetical protein CK934_01675 [Chitinophaga sp. MD30]UCJ07283.1 hypothetical protein KTO58_27090 [Chitinophaga pendula]
MFDFIRKYFSHNKQDDKYAGLKKNGKQLLARFDDLQIIPSEEQITLPIEDTTRVQMLDALAGKEHSQEIRREGCYLVYAYKDSAGAVKKLVSPYIGMDHATLSFKLLAQKEISIYINPVNTEEYYFDISFLLPTFP